MKSENSNLQAQEIPERILSRWGRSILSSGWTTIPNEVLNNQSKLGLTNSELVLIIHLISFLHNSDSKIYPSINVLSSRMNQDRRTIQRTISSLEKKDILKKTVRSKGLSDKGMTNLYDLSPLMLKLINLKIPSLQKPIIDRHKCPKCGKVSVSKEQIDEFFGFRTVDGILRVQSWCKECRGRKSTNSHDVSLG